MNSSHKDDEHPFAWWFEDASEIRDEDDEHPIVWWFEGASEIRDGESDDDSTLENSFAWWCDVLEIGKHEGESLTMVDRHGNVLTKSSHCDCTGTGRLVLLWATAFVCMVMLLLLARKMTTWLMSTKNNTTVSTASSNEQQHASWIVDEHGTIHFHSSRSFRLNLERLSGLVVSLKQALTDHGVVANHITFGLIAEDPLHAERREDILSKDWLKTFCAVRDRSFTCLANSFFWLLIIRVCVGLCFHYHFVDRAGLDGLMDMLLTRLSDRCTPHSLPPMDKSSWIAYSLSLLGGAYDSLSVASAHVSQSLCYAMDGLVCGLLLGAMLLVLVAVIKQLPSMLRTFACIVGVMTLSDVSNQFVGIWVTVYWAYFALVYSFCNRFMALHFSKAPTAHELDMFAWKVDRLTVLSTVLPLLPVCFSAGQMTMAASM